MLLIFIVFVVLKDVHMFVCLNSLDSCFFISICDWSFLFDFLVVCYGLVCVFFCVCGAIVIT
jgi:hypothetical protein